MAAAGQGAASKRAKRAKSPADLCSFARSAIARKRNGQAERLGGVGKAKAERDDEAMDYLWKPSPPFVAGLTLCVADAKATLVAELKIKQFWAIPLAGKVVAGPCMVTMPPCVLYRVLGRRSRTGELIHDSRCDSGQGMS